MSKCDDSFNPAVPALMVLVGNTARKHRVLGRHVNVLGRAHGCDIGLSAPDVSSIHCIIYHRPDGLYLRDCQSRSGTHLNGKAVQESSLHDGDTIQVGPFSFQVYLPSVKMMSCEPSGEAVSSLSRDSGRTLERRERSRRRLAHHALRLRQRLREHAATEVEQTSLAARQQELDHQAEFLRARARDYENRARRLEELERTLSAERAALEQARTDHSRATTQRDEETIRRRTELESVARRLLRLRRRLRRHRNRLAAERATLDHQRKELALEREQASQNRTSGVRHEVALPFQEELVRHRQWTGGESLDCTPLPGQWADLQAEFAAAQAEAQRQEALRR